MKPRKFPHPVVVGFTLSGLEWNFAKESTTPHLSIPIVKDGVYPEETLSILDIRPKTIEALARGGNELDEAFQKPARLKVTRDRHGHTKITLVASPSHKCERQLLLVKTEVTTDRGFVPKSEKSPLWFLAREKHTASVCYLAVTSIDEQILLEGVGSNRGGFILMSDRIYINDRERVICETFSILKGRDYPIFEYEYQELYNFLSAKMPLKLREFEAMFKAAFGIKTIPPEWRQSAMEWAISDELFDSIRSGEL